MRTSTSTPWFTLAVTFVLGGLCALLLEDATGVHVLARGASSTAALLVAIPVVGVATGCAVFALGSGVVRVVKRLTAA